MKEEEEWSSEGEKEGNNDVFSGTDVVHAVTFECLVLIIFESQ